MKKEKPVCLLADGLPYLKMWAALTDMFVFLKGINGDYDDSGILEWAKNLGWSK